MGLVYGVDYKHCCVVDADGNYITFVLVKHEPVYMPPPLGEDGAPDYSKVETKMDWVVQNHVIQEGERLVDSSITPPDMRWEHGVVVGLLHGRWNDTAATWVEGASAEEITTWELEHPAPPPDPPTVAERVKLVEAQIGATNDRQDFVEDCLAEMAGQVYNV